MKFLKWTVIIAAGIPIVFYLAWLSGNLKNDELKPELATLLAHHPAEIDEQANAYFDVIGMSAPANIEPHAWGAAWLAKARAKDHMLLTEFTPTAPVLNNTTTYSEKLDLPCAKKDIKFNCIELVSHNKSAVESTILAQAERLGRFDAILDKPYQQPYRELTLQSDFPSILPETTVVKLAVTRIALDIAQGHDEVALERWGRETRFILNQANNSYALVDKMVAIANLNRYQNIMADYISSRPKSARSNVNKIMPMLSAFNNDAVSLQPAFASEASIFAREVLSLKQTKVQGLFFQNINNPFTRMLDELFGPFFDPYATANGITENLIAWSYITTLEGNDLLSAIKIENSKQQAQSSLQLSALIFNYHNPLGKILIYASHQSDPKLTSYIWKSHSILANNKLLVFSLGMLSHTTLTPEQIQQEIQAHKAELLNPYTAELPVWNKDTSILSYPIPLEFKDVKTPVVLSVKLQT